MVSIVIKFQRCGKKNCRCAREGQLHGPYFWAVSYKGSQKGRMKYKWIYLGKAIEPSIEKLSSQFPEIKRKPTHDQLQSRLQRLLERYEVPKDGEKSPWQTNQVQMNLE
jgi:hypothetical protein